MNMKWPPSICEFLEICEQKSGMPTVEEVIQLAIRREFSHPLVKSIFDKIGSWAFQHDAEKDLRKKVRDLYLHFVGESRMKSIESRN